MATSADVLSELLISQLLEEDLLLLSSAKEAEKLQLDQVIAISARSKGRIPKFSNLTSSSIPPSDGDIAFQIYAADARVSSDAAYAQSLQLSAGANIADLQYAQTVAAAEKKLMLDAEFARRLQAVDEQGMDVDRTMDAERLLGKNAVEDIMTFDPNDKGKGKHNIKNEDVDPILGKGKARQIDGARKRMRLDGNGNEIGVKTEIKTEIKLEPKLEPMDVDLGPESSHIYPTCGICLEAFQVTHSPLVASQSANSSNRLPFGLRLPCPHSHAYCISCLSSYIKSKLDPEGDGQGKPAGVVFPIRCPECPLADWVEGITDAVAEKIMDEKFMVLWYHQKILDSTPRLYCPNPKCSAMVEAHEDADQPQALCPSCNKSMCIPCRVQWHINLSCEEFQALPIDERSPEDRLLLELAKAKKWRRCPNCSVIVELTIGCNHITCPCGTHFCFKCGSRCTPKGKCLRNPPCELWDEDMLLREEERQRERAGAVVAVGQPIVHHAGLAFVAPQNLNHAPPPYVQHHHYQPQPAMDLEWMDDPDIICGRHWFTTDMIRNLTCGYCNLPLNSLADLRYHLAHVRRHPVYACCGRFFRRVEDFDRHVDTFATRFGGDHVRQVRTD